jgi:hypothetical protein
VDHQQDDLSGFLRRIVADACSRVALIDGEADLRRPLYRAATMSGVKTPEIMGFIPRLG